MRSEVQHADMRDWLGFLSIMGESFDCCVTDPPYELGFMGKSWDSRGVAFDPETWRAVYDVLKPGAHLLAFGGTRTFHRMAVAIEDAGFEMRDTLMWLYGTGFPKSLNVGKGIDALITTGGSGPKNLRQRDMGDGYRPHDLAGTPGYGDGRMSRGADTDRDYKSAPPIATPEAAAWEGWGTALKPAWEPIIMARKPLIGTVATNVLAHGTGALNIDGCRVGAVGGGTHCNTRDAAGRCLGRPDRRGTAFGLTYHGAEAVGATGRWPANVLHDGSAEVEEAFAAYGSDKGQAAPLRETGRARPSKHTYGDMGAPAACEPRDALGSASRFFYSAKASAADRAGSKHPTVKPIALMRYLVRLVTPPGGTVLDPFAGSGTTGAAAAAEGFGHMLIEREAEYVEDIRRRLGHVGS